MSTRLSTLLFVTLHGWNGHAIAMDNMEMVAIVTSLVMEPATPLHHS